MMGQRSAGGGARRGRASAAAAALVLALAMTTAVPRATAQIGPSASEGAAYQGLHAAAYAGDAASIRRQVAAHADIEARDSHGRTALHVATSRMKRDAIRALAEAGARLE